MLCTLEWVGLVPPMAAQFSFEMDVVLVGVALHFLAPPDFHVRARANVCVCVRVSMYLSCVCVCVCVCVCPSICLSVTALAASAYVYTAKQHAQVHVRM